MYTNMDPNQNQNKHMQDRWNSYWSKTMWKTMLEELFPQSIYQQTKPVCSTKEMDIETYIKKLNNCNTMAEIEALRVVKPEPHEDIPEIRTYNLPYSIPSALEQLRHNPKIELTKRKDWGTWRVSRETQPDPKDIHHRKLAPTYGAWNLQGIQDILNFLQAIKPILTPQLAHALEGVFKHTLAYDHGNGKGKTLLCTVWKNNVLSHYELYGSSKKMQEQRGSKRYKSGWSISASTITRLLKSRKSTIHCGKGYEGTMCVQELK